MKDYLAARLRDVLSGREGVPDGFEPELELPGNPEHGDLATNTALRLAGALSGSPRAIAEDLAARLRDATDPERVAAIEVAGPGFINFRFAEAHLQRGLEALLAAGERYGRSEAGLKEDGTRRRALVEYVSANPTGPLTVGHGRNAVLGDAIANLLDQVGYDVTREYYFNDAGRQMRVLGQSVQSRYRALFAGADAPTKTLEGADGEPVTVPEDFPEDGYRGEYVTEIAEALRDEHGDALLEEESAEPFKTAAEETIFAEIEATLARLGVQVDSFFNEKSLYDDGQVWDALDRLRDAGYVYDEDGATWLETTRTGKDQDTVLVKSSGEPTYRLPDIAYHADKFARGFDLMIDVFGADHIATYPDVLSALGVLGHDTERVEVVIYQFVTLVRGGEPVKMSTRAATYDTLDDLIDEVGADVARFFFVMRSPGSHLEFDLDLAKEASEKNPVFYLQYAHTRVCSILRKAEEEGVTFSGGVDLSLLEHEAETALIKELLRFPDAVQQAAEARQPHRIVTYLREVAVAFTHFYGHCHILGEARPLRAARMRLARAAQIVLRNGLEEILGVAAPERM